MMERPLQQLTSIYLFPAFNLSALTLYSSGSAATSWSILPSGGLKSLQTFMFNLTAPGTNPSRQDAPHPHEVILDPTGSFIVVPDLGADLVRVFSVDPKTSLLTETNPFLAPADLVLVMVLF
jgi:6-phosphogluconolactonase (cycloisomerase 2 family)